MRALVAVAMLAGMMVLAGCQGPQSAGSPKGQQYVQAGREYQQQGLNDSALAAFALALEENPRLVDAYMGMGDIYRQQGKLDDAGKSYEQAATLAPTSYDAHYYLGLVKQLMGSLNEAVAAYLRALAIKPDSFEATQNLASAYVQLGRASDALTYATRATELKPGSQAGWANLAATYSLLGRYDEAVDAYRQAAELGEAAEPILLGLADAHIRLGHFDRAKVVLDQIVRKNPTCIAYERMGFVQFRQSKYEEALASFRHALQLDGNDVASLNGLGVCLMTIYVQSGRTSVEQRDESLKAWRRSLELRPTQPRIIDLMARYQHF
ncbi:MAG: tetratricopeptide repeat protein [Planctomycetota bacterium]|nr:tetratricopeptide repeat protein [Planctomycetota bacterium]